MKLTYEVSNLDGVIANIYASDREFTRGVIALNEQFSEEAREIAFQLCPKDTWYMSEHIQARLTEKGFGWSIGWDAADFVGVVNPVSRHVMTFYPPEVEMGAMGRSPQPTLRPTMDSVRDDYRERLRELTRAAFTRARG